MAVMWSCPYWHKDKGERVTCEAGSVCFPDRAARMDYIRRFCASSDGWKNCQMAKMMDDYYERGG